MSFIGFRSSVGSTIILREMNTQVLIAGIAALSAFIVALISAWATRQNTRDLELLKSALSGRDASRGMVRDETRAVLAHMGALVAAIQRLKDAALLLGAAPDGSEHLRSARASFEAAAGALRQTFAEADASLSKTEHDAAHHAKRISIKLLQRIAMTNDGNSLPAEARWELDNRRLELTAVQAELRDARVRRLLGVAEANAT
jgi:hypothetical protein